MTYQELRTMSLDFRRTSSNLLNASTDNADVVLARFKKFVDDTPFIAELLKKTMAGIDYEFKECFKIDGQDWDEIDPPVDESCHIKAQYDYMTYLCESKIDILNAALGYCHSPGTTYGNIIREFIDSAFKPLIDYINDAISKEMILLEETQKHSPSMVQNFNAPLYGTAVQGAGTISSHNTTIVNDISDIIKLIEKITTQMDDLDVPSNKKDDVKDDLEVISEQIKSESPKKNRLQKAISGVKKFSSDFGTKLALTVAVNTVANADWVALIDKVEKFINNLV